MNINLLKHIAFKIMVLCIILPSQVNGLELGGGIAGVEEGDDRYRPASALHLGIGETFDIRNYLYGRKLGPYLERTIVTSFNYKFIPYSKFPNVKAGIGATTLIEHAQYQPENNSETSETKDQFNAGAAFGLAYRVPWQNVLLSFNWDAHLYLAGSAGIMMSTGRKQMLGITTGIRF